MRYQKHWSVVPDIERFQDYLKEKPFDSWKDDPSGEVMDFDDSDIRLYVEKNNAGDIVLVDVESPVGHDDISVDELWNKIPGESKEWAELMSKINNRYITR